MNKNMQESSPSGESLLPPPAPGPANPIGVYDAFIKYVYKKKPGWQFLMVFLIILLITLVSLFCIVAIEIIF